MFDAKEFFRIALLNPRKLFFIFLLFDFLSLLCAYYELPLFFLIQGFLLVSLMSFEVVKKGLCQNGNDFKIFYMALLASVIFYFFSYLISDGSLLTIVGGALLGIATIRILLPRLIYYYYKHGAF